MFSVNQLDKFISIFSLQYVEAYGEVRLLLDGSIISAIYEGDKPDYAPMTGTAIVEMQPGQKVSDSLLFLCCMKLTTLSISS